MDSASTSYADSWSSRQSRSPSVSSSSSRIVPIRVVEFLEFYPKRRFHPVHLNDTFQGGRYEVIRKLGFGSFSTVWLARDSKLDRYVALKIGQAETSPTIEMDIYKRLKHTKALSHPGRTHYLPLLDKFRFTGPSGIHETLVYEPMAASVQEVKDLLFGDSPLPLGMARSILWQTLLGLDFMIANGVVHGDVQPRNLLFTLGKMDHVPVNEMAQDEAIPLVPVNGDMEDVQLPKYLVPSDPLMAHLDISQPFKIKITDLGGSFLPSNPPSEPSPPLQLRSPETIFQKHVSASQDMWSFGCLLFELLTGIALFDLMDHPVTSITNDMHFIDMYNVLGPPETTVRDRQWPDWRMFFKPNGELIWYYPRNRDRDFDIFGNPTQYTMEELLDQRVSGSLPDEEVETVKHLLRELLEFDPEKRFTTQDVMKHKCVFGRTFDYIVVGGGTTGLPLAVRLAQSHTVALIEAGGHYEITYPLAKIPGADSLAVGSDPQTKSGADWGFITTPQAGANGRRVHFARGKCLGGSSALNFMVYQRPCRQAMDMWAEAVNDSSYTFDNAFPYYQRTPRFNPPNTTSRFPNATVNYNASAFNGGGPLEVSYSNYVTPLTTWMARGMQGIGLTEALNFNNGDLDGWHYAMSTIRPRDQSRSSSESAFSQDLLNPNLTVYTNTMAKRILFDKERNANGVEIHDGHFSRTLQASKEVVVSAGVFQSPQLLMVSGIGPRAHLEEHKIGVISDLQGVGQGMLDHPFFGPSYRVNVETLTSLATHPSRILAEVMRWETTQQGVLTSTNADMLAWEKIPSDMRGFSEGTLQNLSTFPTGWPEAEYMVGPGYLGNFSSPFDDQPRDGYQYGSLLGILIAGTSQGTVTLASNDTYDPPIINPNWLQTESDQQLAVAMFKRLRQAFASEEMKPVVIGEEYHPGPHVQSDEDILNWIRDNIMTLWHPSRTCKMGTRDDPLAVVDGRARVFGVNRLRVVDASAIPFLPPGHPQAVCYMLAEKIAEDILAHQ
ncbi:hypothetical protein BDV18DRAFT_158665 [Aspergillus unguis]